MSHTALQIIQRLHPGGRVSADRKTREVPSSRFVFATDELARLGVYRTELVNGFCTNWVEGSSD